MIELHTAPGVTIDGHARDLNIFEARTFQGRGAYSISSCVRQRAVCAIKGRCYSTGHGRQMVYLLRGTVSVPASQLDGATGVPPHSKEHAPREQSDRGYVVEGLGRNLKVEHTVRGSTSRFFSL